MNLTLPRARFAQRWLVYCRERFPLLPTAVLIAAFTFATQGLAAGRIRLPGFVAGFAVAFLCLLELRILDEFKDADDDARFRPYRPVPRGLVTLPELAGVGVTAAVLQAMLAAVAGPVALAALAATFAWMALMAREFFVRRWLRAHPLAYLATHTIVMPLLALTVAAVGGAPARPSGCAAYLALTCAASVVIELGRKLRAPADEETGVETYTALWGMRTAVRAWLACIAASAVLATLAASATRGATATAVLGVGALVVAGWHGRRLLARPAPGAGKALQAVSGLWVAVAYAALGIAALAGAP